jgi:hypothetical protein
MREAANQAASGFLQTCASINIDAPQQLLRGNRTGLFPPPRTLVGRNRLRRNLLDRIPLHQLYNMLRSDHRQRRQLPQ